MAALSNALLQKHLDNKDLVKVHRHADDPDFPITGFLIAFSDTLLLLQREQEFQLNGFFVLLRSEVEELVCGAPEKTMKRIYAAEGLLNEGYGLAAPLPLDSWSNLFRELRRLDYHVIVECEDSDPDFFIGPITQVSLRSVVIQYYDATGELMEDTTLIPFEQITRVSFGDRYTTIFRKYLKSPGKRRPRLN